VRAKVRAEAPDPRDAVRLFSEAVKDRRFATEPGARYGLAVALMRAKEPKAAEAEVARLRAMKVASPMIDTLEARARAAEGDNAGALAVLKASRARYPQSRAVLYANLDLLQEMNRPEDVINAIAEPLRFYPRDVRLHEARARAYAAQGKRLLQHQAQAEVYALRGSLPAAIEQLQLAQSSGEGNFYDLSVVEARLKELRAQHQREMADEKKQR
jgi:predicted Zn-dependent protease